MSMIRLAERARSVLVIAFVVQLPAEVVTPLFRVGPLSVTNLELTGYLLLAAYAVSLLGARSAPRLSRVGAAGLAVFFAGALASSAVALYDPDVSAKTVLRLAGALFIGLALAHEVLASTSQWLRVAGALLLGVALSAALGIADFVSAGNLTEEYARLFRDGHLIAGGFTVRATGTFLHPNLAAWLWGIAAVGAVVAGITTGSRLARWTTLTMAALLLVAVVLALSRGALIGTMIAAVTASLLMVRLGYPRMRAAVVLVPLPLIVAAAALASPVVAARLVSETEQEWYRFSIEAPAAVLVDQPRVSVPVRLTNVTPVHWPAVGDGQVRVSYHLRDTDGEYVEYEGLRTPLPRSLGPGESVTVFARIAAEPGHEVLLIDWDLVQEDRTWFKERYPSVTPMTRATITVPDAESPGHTGGRAGPTPSREDVLTSRSFGRRTLWRVAGEMVMARPVLGIGLDNFRLGYGGWLGLSAWDTDINTNNLYLELAVSVGLFALALLAVAVLALLRLLRATTAVTAPTALALIVLMATVAHGFFDSFLTYSTGAYIISWAIMIGLIELPPREVAR